MRLQTSHEWPWGHMCDLLLPELPSGQEFNDHMHPEGPEVGESPGLWALALQGSVPRHVRHAGPRLCPCASPLARLTLMVSSSMRSRLFSDRRSLFLVSICCSCVSNSASYSRLPSWNSRSSSCVFSALWKSQTSENNSLSTHMLLSVIRELALYSTAF